MPIYEYICDDCTEKFSLLQSISAASNGTACPKCSSKKTRKVVSAFCCSSSDPGGGFSSSGHSHGHGGG